MGTKAKSIVELDIAELIGDLNRAYADEWLVYYQYWIAAQLMIGRSARPVVEELRRIAAEELAHAQELAERIVQLGGRPLTHPKQWFEKTNCVYKEPPQDPTQVDQILKDAIAGEECAIDVYYRLYKKVEGKDATTMHLARHILDEELKHEDTLESLLS
jgi:bacterioferritin